MKKEMNDLKARIARFLADDKATSKQGFALQQECESAIEGFERIVASHAERAMDLDVDVDEADRASRSATLNADQLRNNILPMLDDRVDQIRAAETLVKRQAKFDKVSIEHDSIAAELGGCQLHAELMADLLTRIAKHNEACAEVGIEGLAVQLLRDVKLIDLTTGRALWPPPTVSVAASMAAAFAPPYSDRYSPNWWKSIAAEDEKKLAVNQLRAKEEEEHAAAARDDYYGKVGGWIK